MFRKRGITREEIARHNDIKQNITKELSVSIQKLQQDHLNKDDPVLSTDSANAVCNVLEAVFLHGLKPSVSKKIAKYVGMTQGYDGGASSINFWQFMDKFTHSDVVAQLKRLGQVTTEIGLCRAWIRVALNDGLMGSYVDAMIADKKTLEYFYHSTAYLRDLEQPGILKNYLKGLMLLQFQLSYNSSVLNSWPNHSLVLAGVINPEATPPPVIHPNRDKRQNVTKTKDQNTHADKSIPGSTPVSVNGAMSRSREDRKDKVEPVDVVTSSSSSVGKKSSTSKSRKGKAETMSPSSNPSNFSEFSAPLSRSDIDEIRGMKAPDKTRSECSSSSHVSHPDPVKYNLNPVEYVRNKSIDDGLFSMADTDELRESPGSNISAEVSITEQRRAQGSFDSFDEPVEEDYLSIKATPEVPITNEQSEERLSESFDHDVETDGLWSLQKSTEQTMEKCEDEVHVTDNTQSSNQCNIDSSITDTTVAEDISTAETEVKSASGDLPSKGISEEHLPTHSDENDGEIVHDVEDRESSNTGQEQIENAAGESKEPEEQVKKEVTSEPQNLFDLPIETHVEGTILTKFIPREITEAENTRKLEDILNHDVLDTDDKVVTGNFSEPSGSNTENHDFQTGGRSKGTKHSASRRDRLKPTLSPTRKEMVQPDLSPAVADSIQTMGREERFSPPALMNGHRSPLRPRSGAMSVSGDEYSGGTSEMVSSPASIGNSLNGRNGWSSSFEADALDHWDGPEGTRHQQSKDGIPIGNRPKTESFGTILKDYAPSSNIASPTLEDIIQELPDTGSYPSPPTSRDTPRHNSTSQEDFEIVNPSSAHVSQHNPDKFTQHQLSLLGEIATEKGLDSQNYQCGSCKRPIGLIYGKPRVCIYDGCYYCFECHENQEYYIPAFIIHNWDFRKHYVSKKSLQFLQDAEDQSTIDISVINPKLYEHVKEMHDAKLLRRQLCHLRTYLFTCKQSIADEFRKAVWPKDYLYESVHKYTLSDLLQVPSGQFAQSLRKVIKFASKHVYGCPLCSGKGHICELCYSHKVIYPFEIENTTRCPKCKSVFHKVCKTESKSCPKCERRNKRRSMSEDSIETPEIHDYAFSPLT